MMPPKLKTRLRVWRMGLATLFGGRPGGWFVPYRYAHTVDAPVAYPELEPVFAAAEPRFAEMLRAIDRHAASLEAIGDAPPPQPRWAQGWFPRLDAATAYTIVRDRAPARIVEIGSGHSTRFMARAIADGGLATRLTAIDPAPRADIAALEINHVRATAHSADIALFEGRGLVWAVHRPSMARRFDRAIVFRSGKAVENDAVGSLDRPGTALHDLIESV